MFASGRQVQGRPDVDTVTTQSSEAWSKVCSWSMRQRLACAGSKYSDESELLSVTEWVIKDLNDSLEGSENFLSWKPNPPQERDVDVISALVHNPCLPHEAALMIVGSGWWRVKPQVLLHRDLDFASIRLALSDLTDGAPFPLWHAASFSLAATVWVDAFTSHSDFCARDWDYVIEHAWAIPRLMSMVAIRSDLHEDQSRRLANHPSAAVRQRIARNRSVSEPVRVLAALNPA